MQLSKNKEIKGSDCQKFITKPTGWLKFQWTLWEMVAVLHVNSCLTCDWCVVKKNSDIYAVFVKRFIFCSIVCYVKDYNDHISEISNKLVAIMDSMLEMNISKVWLSHLYINVYAVTYFINTLIFTRQLFTSYIFYQLAIFV